MRTTRALVVVAALTLLVSTPLQAAERIQGAELFTDGTTLNTLYPQLIGMPFDQDEVDLFLGNIDKIIAWAAKHKTEWDAVEGADDPFTVIRGLELWETMEISPGEFIAVFMKLKTAQELESGGIDAATLREQVQFMKEMLANPDMPEESKARMKEQVEMLDEMISGFESYPEGNRSTYAANKERIDDALTRFEAATDDAKTDDAGKTGTATPNDG